MMERLIIEDSIASVLVPSRSPSVLVVVLMIDVFICWLGELKTGSDRYGWQKQAGLLAAVHTEEEAVPVSIQSVSVAMSDGARN